MSLTIQMLGTGSAFSKKYYNNNALVQYNGYNLLLDCGYTAPKALHELNIKPYQIDSIFVTHLHADHIGGLEEFAFEMMYTYKKRPNLFIPTTLRHSLWEHALRGGLENHAENIDSLDHYFQVQEIPEGIRTEIAPGFTLETFATKHVNGKPSYALLFNDHLFYSSDTCFDRKLLDTIFYHRNCTTIFHDCQLFNPQTVHATLDDLLTLPTEMQKVIYLMHYDDNMEHYKDKTGHMTFALKYALYSFPLEEQSIY
ncbi:MAG: MBL fold metallo-hydrolase [Paenibacillaceae bacterium]